MAERAQTERLQSWIDAALRETPEETSATLFSPYLHDSSDLVAKMKQAARENGLEAAFDLFDRLRASEDLGRLRYALLQFLIDSPERAEAGLHVPSPLESTPWKFAPSNRKE